LTPPLTTSAGDGQQKSLTHFPSIALDQIWRGGSRRRSQKSRSEGYFLFPAMAFTNVLLRRRGEIRKLVRIMKRFRFAPGLACALFICGGATVFGQAPTDAVRVTMSMHPDGSRTVYNFDNGA